MSRPAARDIIKVLATVVDPGGSQSIVAAGFVSEALAGEDGFIRLTLRLPNPASPLVGPLKEKCRAVLQEAFSDAAGVVVTVSGEGKDARAKEPVNHTGANPERIPGIRHTIAVASGKGGVGKSTVAVNLAAAMLELGYSVGVLDADITGPSVPIMLHTEAGLEGTGDKKILPPVAHGIKTVSMGHFIDVNESLIWRGPMMQKALLQFCGDVLWGGLDYLFLDLPPGTGDIQLTLAQQVKTDGAVVVTTPQDIALADVIRANAMFGSVGIRVLGVVENMSGFVCPHCGKVHHIFARGGGENYAQKLGLPFLGAVPLDPLVREWGDRGQPVVQARPGSKPAEVFRAAAKQLADALDAADAAEAGHPAMAV